MLSVVKAHSLPVAEVKSRVQKWLDWNYLWPPSVRINNLQWSWNPLNANALMFSGTVGTTKYSFKGNLIITSQDISVQVGDPAGNANTILGIKKGWSDELGKILNKVQPTPIIAITQAIPQGMSQSQAIAAVAQGAAAAMRKDGQLPRVLGNQVSFFYPLSRKSVGIGESQVYGLATIASNGTNVELAVRAPTLGEFAEYFPTAGKLGAMVMTKRYAKQWEQTLGNWLAGVPAKKPVPPSPPTQTVQKTPAASKSDGESKAPWIIGGLVAAGGILAIALGGKKKRRAA